MALQRPVGYSVSMAVAKRMLSGSIPHGRCECVPGHKAVSSAKASQLEATCVAFSSDYHKHMHDGHSTEGLVKLQSKKLCARTCY